MRGRSARIRRAAAASWLSLSLFAALPAAALADPTARGYAPHPNHLSVVVTTDLVYVTWTDPVGVQPTRVFAYRGDGSTCPTGSTDGTPIAIPSVTNHFIDPNVTVGSSYCYTVFVEDAAGTRVKVGSTGPVPVPDPKAPPPSAAPTPTPTPSAPASGSSGLDTTQVKAIFGSGGVLLALLLLAVIVRMLRRSRTADAGPVFGTELRMTFTGLSVSALIIPAVIALAWVLVVTALVVFR
jgi:hypothetical protein